MSEREREFQEWLGREDCPVHFDNSAETNARYGFEAGRLSGLEEAAKEFENHWLSEIICNHDNKTDISRCACGQFESAPQPSVGDAVKRHIEHVMKFAQPAG